MTETILDFFDEFYGNPPKKNYPTNKKVYNHIIAIKFFWSNANGWLKTSNNSGIQIDSSNDWYLCQT